MLQIARHASTIFAVTICISSVQVLAAGGTSIVATKGQPAHVSNAWPEGVAALVNDPARTTGWNSWFSEWPNDVNHYGYEIETTDDLNRLIENLSSVKCEMLQIRLSHLKEPRGLGWVTHLPVGNDIAVVFSLGDQSRIDQWYKHVRKPFGAIEFTAAPVAVPPTLTLFVQNDAVKLDKLKIPNGIAVKSGYVPHVFHRSNTTREKKAQEEAGQRPNAAADGQQQRLDSLAQAAADKISAFLSTRNSNDRTTK